MVANPLSYLWFGQIQNDTAWWNGDLLDDLDEDAKVMNTTTNPASDGHAIDPDVGK